jgi:hypothetical protein
MQILLDTQVFLWFLADSRRLSSRARKLIVAAERVFVSSASIWECCIKVGLGRIEIDPAALWLRALMPADSSRSRSRLVTPSPWRVCRRSTRTPSTACSWLRRSAMGSCCSLPIALWRVTRRWCAEPDIIGSLNILEACRHHPVEHLVYASCSSVCGGYNAPDPAHSCTSHQVLSYVNIAPAVQRPLMVLISVYILRIYFLEPPCQPPPPAYC